MSAANGRKFLVWVGCIAVLACGVAAHSEDVQNWQVIHPVDNGAALENPGMGWVLHYYDNVPANYGSRLEPSDTVDEFPGLTVVYLRIPWSYLEPAEGRYCWSVLDTPAQRWVSRGKKIALRISCSESWMRYATPEWVEKAGAKGYNFRVGQGVTEDGPFWEPDYNDPVFLEKLDHFLSALAARYDGNPEVAFIDVGSFGVWGEGHTFSSTRIKYPAETVIRHIDLYRKHFKHTLLAANDDFVMTESGERAIAHALEHGLTLRDDSILVQKRPNSYFHAAMAQDFWPRLPVILESEHYGPSRDRGAWEDGTLYFRAMLEYHASYVSIHWWPHEFLKENKSLVDRMNRYLGYRLVPTEVRFPQTATLGKPFTWSVTLENRGVAPCYCGGFPALTLKDAQDGIVAVLVNTQANVRDLRVRDVAIKGPKAEGDPEADLGPPIATTWETASCLPFQLRPGRYRVFLSVGTATGTPQIALPIDGDDDQHRYFLGEVEITSDAELPAGK
ncbi:DUF4832 domain-containing protein [Thermogutta sp.]|uniref:DUF4832 domain-containing protein n=1 Tax=Thermogutta sp. TaxID=1962930 RepID=UPI00321FF5C8